MTKRPPLLLVALAALLPACGHKGDPLPPLRRTPPAPGAFRLAQRGDALELQAVAPAASVEGVRYETSAIEFLYGNGQLDLAKAGRRLPVRVEAGALAVTTLPLPPPGTLVRAAARGLERGERGPRSLTMTLVAQPPVAPPRELAVVLGEAGPELSWKGERPKEVAPPPLPKPAPPRSSPGASTPASAAASPAGAPRPAAPPASAPAASAPAASAPPSAPAAGTPPAGPAAPPAAGGEAKPAEGAATPTRRRNGFFVYRRSANAGYAAPLGEEPLDRRSFRDETAALGSTWCYVVRAVASSEPLIESAPSNEVCLERRDLTPPATPAGLAVLPRPAGLELLWSPSSDEDLAGYRVYRSASGAAPERLAELGPGKAGYLDEKAVKGVVYRYTLTAFDAAGNESEPTEAVEASLP